MIPIGAVLLDVKAVFEGFTGFNAGKAEPGKTVMAPEVLRKAEGADLDA